MRDITKIIVHCSDSPPDQDIGVEEIRQWHKDAPHYFQDVGYHHVIRRDGTLEEGRPLEQAGAHARGHNFCSIGVCLVGGYEGEFDFTFAQMTCLVSLIDYYESRFPDAEVMGHRDLEGVKKSCPNFNVREFLGEHHESRKVFP